MVSAVLKSRQNSKFWKKQILKEKVRCLSKAEWSNTNVVVFVVDRQGPTRAVFQTGVKSEVTQLSAG